MLAATLLGDPGVLLLDEPTNHLDADAKAWLMKFLRGYRGALLVISHDLDLLDEAITRVLHLDRSAEEATGHLVEYKGTYSQYLAARAKDEVRLAKLASEQQAEVVRLQTRADQFRAGTKARMAQSMDKRIARLKGAMVDAPKGQKALRVHFPEPPHCGRVVLEVAGLAKSYGGPAVFEDVGFDVGRGERLLVLGLNGAGKTSLLRILADVSTSDAGEVRFGHDVVAGYYAQEHEGLDPHRTLLDHIKESAPLLTEATQRGLLGMFGLTGEKAFQEAGTLSGGEKTKLALSLLVAGRRNLLLLDEPTNNLDPPSRESVADALASWPGALILVSHDTEFVEQLSPTKVLLMPDGELDYFNPNWLELVELA